MTSLRITECSMSRMLVGNPLAFSAFSVFFPPNQSTLSLSLSQSTHYALLSLSRGIQIAKSCRHPDGLLLLPLVHLSHFISRHALTRTLSYSQGTDRIDTRCLARRKQLTHARRQGACVRACARQRTLARLKDRLCVESWRKRKGDFGNCLGGSSILQ